MRDTHTNAARRTTLLLWIVQVALAGLFLFAGGMKLVLPIEAMTQQTPLPGAFLRFIGVVELLGGLGLVLPGLLRIRPELTPLAAAGLVVIMSGATGATMATGAGAGALAPVVVGLGLAVVGYGRWRVAPHGSSRAGFRARVLRAA
jgi:uncharacterized membrane protein YphA (DoxX/SURF4 family)